LEEHASRPATVRGDRLQLQHALVHLLDNAFDAVESLQPADRQVTVTTETDSARVIVRVRDVGAGLGGADIQKLCEPFFTTKEGHAGLGLTISRRIITSHDGELRAATHESGGAIFQLEIPASC
jgi:C4-dicarboxylate-specific signal transduction histidine kinase